MGLTELGSRAGSGKSMSPILEVNPVRYPEIPFPLDRTFSKRGQESKEGESMFGDTQPIFSGKYQSGDSHLEFNSWLEFHGTASTFP